MHFLTAQYTFFENAHGTFTKIQYILGHTTICKKVEIMQNVNELEVKIQKLFEKNTHIFLNLITHF